MCSPALHLLDPGFRAPHGSALRPALARTLETVRQLKPPAGAAAGGPGFAHIERLRDNVGYLELRAFEWVDTACDTIATAMNELDGSDALVIDLRRNRGGDRRTAALLTSYLFDTEPVHLGERYASSQYRHAETAPLASSEHVPAHRYLRPDVYVLLGPATSALGREFARNLERLRGATVVEDVA